MQAVRDGEGECFWKSKGTFMSFLHSPKEEYETISERKFGFFNFMLMQAGPGSHYHMGITIRGIQVGAPGKESAQSRVSRSF